MKTEQFDERQTQIRGNVFFRGLLFAMGLVLINAFLQDNGVIWASGFYQNILVFLATTMFVSIEAILRGVFFRHRQTHWPMIGLYGVGGIVIIVYELVKFSTFPHLTRKPIHDKSGQRVNKLFNKAVEQVIRNDRTVTQTLLKQRQQHHKSILEGNITQFVTN